MAQIERDSRLIDSVSEQSHLFRIRLEAISSCLISIWL